MVNKRIPKKLHILLILVTIVFFFTSIPVNAIQVKDATGVNVVIKQQPKRVICLSPHLTEIVFYLGAEKLLVGRTKYCNQPPEATKLPSIGGFNDFSTEQILNLKPDLILASRGNPLEKIEQLRRLGLKVYACDDENSLEDIFSTMSKLCSILWLSKHSVFSVKALRAEFNQIRKQSTVTSSSCLYVSPEATLWTCNGETFISQIINYAGLVNVASKLKTRWPLINAEQVMLWDPEYLLVPVDGGNTEKNRVLIIKQLKDHSILKRTQAVKAGKIIIADIDQLMRPSPSLLFALKSIISQIRDTH